MGRMNALAQPQAGIREHQLSPRHPPGQPVERVPGPDRGELLQTEPTVGGPPHEPGAPELVVVVSRHDRHPPTREGLPELLEEGRRGLEGVAQRSVAELDRVAEQHEVVDTLQRREQDRP